MNSIFNLLLLTTALNVSPSLANEWPESPPMMVRRANRRMASDDAAASSRTLFDDFASFFYESMDSARNAENEDEKDEEAISNLSVPSEHSDFVHKLDMISKTGSFSSSPLAIAHGDNKGAFYYMRWFVSGPDTECAPVVNPHIKLVCSNGGRIHVDHPCIVNGIDTAVCVHGYHFLNHVADYVGVWCSGNDETELGLTAELTEADVACSSVKGVMSQGISLGQGCGAFGSEEFRVNVKESFCDDPSQFAAAQNEDENPKCMSSVSATEENLLVSLPAISVSASVSASDEEENSVCIYEITA